MFPHLCVKITQKDLRGMKLIIIFASDLRIVISD